MLRRICDSGLAFILKDKKVGISKSCPQVFWSNAVPFDEGAVKDNLFCFVLKDMQKEI